MKGLMLLGLAGWVVRGAVMAGGWCRRWWRSGCRCTGGATRSSTSSAASTSTGEAPPHLRASAQGIITFVSGGAGVWLGNWLRRRGSWTHYRAGTVDRLAGRSGWSRWSGAWRRVAFAVLFRACGPRATAERSR